MPTTNVDGVEVAYARAGEGPRLLFLHGSGSSMATNALLRAPFERAFDVVTLDHRGTGAMPVPDAPFSMADCAGDAAAVLDAVGWDSCRVVGISFGGMVAQELAVIWPSRIERLALVCTSAGGAGGSSFPFHEQRPGPTDIDTRFTPEWLADHRRDRGLVELLARRENEERGPEAERGAAAQLVARSHHDVWDRLHRIDCPTLVAAGRFDGIAPVANSEAIASRITGAEIRTYEGGHAFFAQDPTAIPDVMEFLAQP